LKIRITIFVLITAVIFIALTGASNDDGYAVFNPKPIELKIPVG